MGRIGTGEAKRAGDISRDRFDRDGTDMRQAKTIIVIVRYVTGMRGIAGCTGGIKIIGAYSIIPREVERHI